MLQVVEQKLVPPSLDMTPAYQNDVLWADVEGLRVCTDVGDELNDLELDLLVAYQEVPDGIRALQTVVAEIWKMFNALIKNGFLRLVRWGLGAAKHRGSTRASDSAVLGLNPGFAQIFLYCLVRRQQR